MATSSSERVSLILKTVSFQFLSCLYGFTAQ